MYQNLLRKREEVKRLEAQGKHKYEYDSDEETEGGTWEHKLRSAEMEATQMWAEELTAQAEGKHHIGDFLPPDELKKFMEQYNAVKQGKEPDLSDYKEYKLKEDNIGMFKENCLYSFFIIFLYQYFKNKYKTVKFDLMTFLINFLVGEHFKLNTNKAIFYSYVYC